MTAVGVAVDDAFDRGEFSNNAQTIFDDFVPIIIQSELNHTENITTADDCALLHQINTYTRIYIYI